MLGIQDNLFLANSFFHDHFPYPRPPNLMQNILGTKYNNLSFETTHLSRPPGFAKKGGHLRQVLL